MDILIPSPPAYLQTLPLPEALFPSQATDGGCSQNKQDKQRNSRFHQRLRQRVSACSNLPGDWVMTAHVDIYSGN